MSRVHLHTVDHPHAVRLVAAVLRGRDHEGFALSGSGAWVDWEALERPWLSSTERATLVVARGIAAAESHGGFPPGIARSIADVAGELDR